jgi:hypothetical protein
MTTTTAAEVTEGQTLVLSTGTRRLVIRTRTFGGWTDLTVRNGNGADSSCLSFPSTRKVTVE